VRPPQIEHLRKSLVRHVVQRTRQVDLLGLHPGHAKLDQDATWILAIGSAEGDEFLAPWHERVSLSALKDTKLFVCVRRKLDADESLETPGRMFKAILENR
jgi:hypothetical protein